MFKDFYFPLFDGYIMQMNPSNAQGFTTITVQCADTLELARISQEMINPAILQVDEFRKQKAINIWAQPLYGLDHMVIFHTMFHGGKVVYTKNGGRIVGDGYSDADVLSYLGWPKKNQKSQFLNFSALGNFGLADEDSEKSTISPHDLANQSFVHKNDFSLGRAIRETSHKSRPRYTSSWGYNITPYRIFNFQAPNIYDSTFSDRLSILRDVAGMTYYELYVDGYGTVHYHPMRFSNDFLHWDIISSKDFLDDHFDRFPGSQIVTPEEVINVSSSFNIEQLVTFLRLSGVHPTLGNNSRSEPLELTGSAIAEEHMARYGYRRKDIKNALFNFNPSMYDNGGNKIANVKFLDVAASALMRYANSELYSRTANIVFRPEMQLARPVFFTDDDMVFYIQSLSHSVTIGGDATTSINGNFGRKDRHPPTDLLNYILTTQKLYNLTKLVKATGSALSALTGSFVEGRFVKESLSGLSASGLLTEEQVESYQQQAKENYKIPWGDYKKGLENIWKKETESLKNLLSKEEEDNKKKRRKKGKTKRDAQANTKNQSQFEKAKSDMRKALTNNPHDPAGAIGSLFSPTKG
jgi:hypothetical protein